MKDSYFVEPARITWQDGNPYAADYGDIYWQRTGAIAEKQHVFVDPLFAKICQVKSFRQVTVAELGFGFGINCLLTCQQWAAEMPAQAQLNFISIEKHPVAVDDLQGLLSPLDLTHTEILTAHYPPAYRGAHVIWLASNIRLLLIFDEVSRALANLDARVDHWFLDGFSPAKNQSMWADDLYKKMFARSHAGATVSTYSAAGTVKRGLASNGFNVQKVEGFGSKREMLTAEKPGKWAPLSQAMDSVVIIGAGLAGSFCSEALARRGISHTVIDSGIAGPSTIGQLTVMPQLAIAPETYYRFSVAACQYMRSAPGYQESSVVWFGRTDEEMHRLQQIAGQFPNDIIEAQADDRVIFHQAGWYAMPSINAPEARVIRNTRVTALERLLDQNQSSESIGAWQLQLDNGESLQTQQVILATGFDRALLPDQLQLRAIRGQAISVGSSNIETVRNGDVTVFPTVGGRSWISGTYSRDIDNVAREADTQDLINQAKPYANIDTSRIETFVGIRSASRDRFPIVGRLPDWDLVSQINRLFDLNRYQQGLHICTAFGSRGATHARLCAEQVVSGIASDPSALGAQEQQTLSPARFAIRDNRQD